MVPPFALYAGGALRAWSERFARVRLHPERRVVLGLGTAQRNIAAATVVAAENVRVPDTLMLVKADTLVLVVVAGVLELLVLFPVARWLRGRHQKAAAIPPGAELAGYRV